MIKMIGITEVMSVTMVALVTRLKIVAEGDEYDDRSYDDVSDHITITQHHHNHCQHQPPPLQQSPPLTDLSNEKEGQSL